MDRRLEAFDGRWRGHDSSAPPPKLKNERKNDEAANAIDSPKTIWISRRKPPAVSPNASVSPVVMMMITATILATGPWTDSRTFCSGSSHGMPDPPAKAGAASRANPQVAATQDKRDRRGTLRLTGILLGLGTEARVRAAGSRP